MSACKDTYLNVLNSLLALVEKTKVVVSRFFPTIKVTAAIIGTLDVIATVPQPIFVFLKWAQLYPGRSLVPTNADDLKVLKNLYISLDLDWEQDPFLMEGMLSGLI
jgi:hypothetical protein